MKFKDYWTGQSGTLEVNNQFIELEYSNKTVKYQVSNIESIEIIELSIWKYLLSILGAVSLLMGVYILNPPVTGHPFEIGLIILGSVLGFLVIYGVSGLFLISKYPVRIEINTVSGESKKMLVKDFSEIL